MQGTEANSTMDLTGLDNFFGQLIMEKLDGKNFRKWVQSIKLAIDGKVKFGYLIGETRQLTSTDVGAFQKWWSENSMVTSLLVNSMKSAIGRTYLFVPTAKDV